MIFVPLVGWAGLMGFLTRFGARFAVVAMVLALSPRGVPAQLISPDLTIARIGDYVERYYSRAQSIIVDEHVAVQRLGSDLRTDGFARRLTYELRVDWQPNAGDDESPAKVTRQLISVNGRPPRPNQEPECLDPKSVSPEPLAFLLPERRSKFRFTAAGTARVEGRSAIVLEYRSLKPEAPKVEWKDECGTVDLPGRARGKIWADPTTAEILRLDEGLIGLVDIEVPRQQQRRGGPSYMTIERADSSIKYRPVTFADPDETLLLPVSIDTVTIIRNSGSPRVRISQTFSNYRRFVTGSRIVQ